MVMTTRRRNDGPLQFVTAYGPRRSPSTGVRQTASAAMVPEIARALSNIGNAVRDRVRDRVLIIEANTRETVLIGEECLPWVRALLADEGFSELPGKPRWYGWHVEPEPVAEVVAEPEPAPEPVAEVVAEPVVETPPAVDPLRYAAPKRRVARRK